MRPMTSQQTQSQKHQFVRGVYPMGCISPYSLFSLAESRHSYGRREQVQYTKCVPGTYLPGITGPGRLASHTESVNAEFEAAKTRSCPQLGTKYIRLLYFNFSYQVYNILLKKYGGFMTQVLEKVLNSPYFLKSQL